MDLAEAAAVAVSVAVSVAVTDAASMARVPPKVQREFTEVWGTTGAAVAGNNRASLPMSTDS